MRPTYFVAAVLTAAVAAGPATAQKKDPGVKNPYTGTNPAVRSAFQSAVAPVVASTARVRVDGKDVAVATVVEADGYLVTKFSELKTYDKLTCKFRGGSDIPATLVGADERFDIALLRVDAKNLKPVKFAASKEAEVGNWVAVVVPNDDPAAVGVVSVAERKLLAPYGPTKVASADSGFLGIGPKTFGEEEEVVIGSIIAKGAAEKAGLKVDDVILKIEGEEIANADTLMNTLRGFKAGETIEILIRRDGKPMTFQATLGKRPADPKKSGFDRGEFQNKMGSKLSDRRTGFPAVLQTDAIVLPADCGAPLVDLDGKVLGVMIARAGRTESWAAPGEAVAALLPDLKKGKGLPKPGETPASRRPAPPWRRPRPSTRPPPTPRPTPRRRSRNWPTRSSARSRRRSRQDRAGAAADAARQDVKSGGAGAPAARKTDRPAGAPAPPVLPVVRVVPPPGPAERPPFPSSLRPLPPDRR